MQYKPYLAICGIATGALLLLCLSLPVYVLGMFYPQSLALKYGAGISVFTCAAYYFWGVPMLSRFYVRLHSYLWPDFKEL